MELTYIVIAALIIVLPLVLTKVLSGRSRDTKTVPGATPPEDRAPATSVGPHAGAPAGTKVRAGESVAGAGGPARGKTGVPLEEGKDVVAAARKDVGATRLAPGLVETIRHAQDVSEEVQRLVKKGRKVEAIKLIREHSGMGLKEAKHLVDRLG